MRSFSLVEVSGRVRTYVIFVCKKDQKGEQMQFMAVKKRENVLVL